MDMDLIVLTVGDDIHVTGRPPEIAAYTALLMEMTRGIHDRRSAEAAKRETRIFGELKNVSIEELMKREQEDGGE